MDCCKSIIAILLFLLSSALVFLGLVMLVVGIAAIVEINDFPSSMHDLHYDLATVAPVILLLVGILVATIGLLGCCGTVMRNKCMLWTFAFCVMVAMVLEIGIVIVGAVEKSSLSDKIESGLKKSLPKYETQKSVEEAWNWLQPNLKCCGAHNYSEWYDTFAAAIIPATCCSDKNDCRTETPPQVTIVNDCGASNTSVCLTLSGNATSDISDYLFHDGCMTKLKTSQDDLQESIGITCGIIIVLQLLIIMGSCLIVKKDEQNYIA